MERGSRGRRNVFSGPKNFVETANAAVQVIFTVIFGERVGSSIQNKFAMSDAIGVTADGGAKMGFIGDITVKIIVAKDYISELSLTVGDFQRHHSRTEIGDGYLDAAVVGEGVQINLLAVGLAKRLFVHSRLRL